MEETVIIVGGGQGGFSTASRLREIGFRGRVTIVGEEEHLPYQRPPLSKAYLLGQTDVGRLSLRPRDYFDKLGIDLALGKRALRLDRGQSNVELADGSILSYDKLVLATGSRARTLPDELSQALSGIFVLRSVSDAEHLRLALASQSRRVLVVGAGFVGLEVAAIGSQMGHSVTVVELSSRVLNRVACEATANAIQALHRNHGVVVKTGTKVDRLHSHYGAVTGAQLSDGSFVHAEIVVVGIGGIANDELAADAGLQTASGIVVDQCGRTSDPNIFALGDCAVFPFEGRLVRIESVQNACDQGAAVADVIGGSTASYAPVPWFWSDQYDAKLQTVGLACDYDKVITLHGSREGSAANWYFRNGRAIAVDTINDPRTHMSTRRLFGAGQSVSIEAVAAEGFDAAIEARRHQHAGAPAQQ